MTMNTKVKGDAFEMRVERLYKKLGKWNVKRNVILYDRFGNQSQIDLTYGYFRKTYIECKNYSDSVPLEMVAKFKEVLNLNKISTKRGIFITSSQYVPRATTIGIKTIDGIQLKQLEKSASRKQITRRLFSLFCFGFLALELSGTTNIRKTISENHYYKETKPKVQSIWREIQKNNPTFSKYWKQTSETANRQYQSLRKKIDNIFK